MTNANDNGPTLRSIDLALERVLGDNEDIDAQICVFFRWAGAAHGQADPKRPFMVLPRVPNGEAPRIRFTRRDMPSQATVPVPGITNSVEEVVALVRAFAPHMEWGLVGYSATSGEDPIAFIAPNAQDPDPGTGAVTKRGPTHAIALLRALLHIIGRDGFDAVAFQEVVE